MVHFPNEIWLGVAKCLKLPTDLCTRKNEAASKDEKITQQTLLSVCLVSKQLRAVFQPQLYCNFVKHQRPAAKDRLLKPDSEWQHKYYQQDERSFRAIRKQTKLEIFLMTMIHRPDLAAMVEHLRIGPSTDNNLLPFCLRKLYEKVPLHETISWAFIDALRSFKGFDRLRNQFRRFWEENLWNGNEGSEVALLLTLLPNLRSLRFDSRSHGLDHFMKGLFNAILNPSFKSWTLKAARGILHKHPVGAHSSIRQPSQILPVLRTLDVWSFGGHNIQLDSFMSLLSQPFITSFNGRGLYGDDPFISVEPEVSFDSLRHLQLIKCVLNGRALENILKRCIKLQSLAINIPDHHVMWRMPITTQDFDALQDMTTTLQRLTLILPKRDTAVHLDLRSFSKLRYLHVDMAVLTVNRWDPPYMHQLLPPNIKRIIVRKTCAWIEPHLDKLVDTMTIYRRFPALKTLEVYTIHEDHLSILEEGMDHTKELARELNLRLIIDDEHSEKHSRLWGHNNLHSESDLDSDQDDSGDEAEDNEDQDENDEVEVED